MIDPTTIMVHGAGLCLLLGALVAASFFWKPRIWLRDFPQDIQDLAAPMTDEEQRVAGRFGLLIVSLMLGSLVLSTLRFGLDQGLLWALLHAYLVFQVFNVFDMAVIDWGLLLLIDPSKPPIEGTENARGWRDFAFHAKKSLKGSILAGFPSPLWRQDWPGAWLGSPESSPSVRQPRSPRTSSVQDFERKPRMPGEPVQ
ncbi:MAG: hypothetical protein AAGA81_15280 [Acidobacteriota bacterium]